MGEWNMYIDHDGFPDLNASLHNTFRHHAEEVNGTSHPLQLVRSPLQPSDYPEQPTVVGGASVNIWDNSYVNHRYETGAQLLL
jgi:hypothetical protein